MKSKRLFTVVTASTAILLFSTVFLAVQNNYYRNENRRLILENDSIMSVNIHLKDTLKKEAAISLSSQ